MDKNGKVDEVWRYVGPKLEMLVTSLEKLDSIKRSFENNDISYDAFLELDDKALKEDLKIDSFGRPLYITTGVPGRASLTRAAPVTVMFTGPPAAGTTTMGQS